MNTVEFTLRLLESLINLSCLGVATGAVVFSARRAATRSLPATAPHVQAAATGLLIVAVIVVVLEILAAVGSLTPGSVLLASVGLAAVVRWVCPRPSGPVLGTNAVLHNMRRWARLGWGTPAIAMMIVAAMAVVRALWRPPLSWDSLTYHMFLPVRWVQDGTITPFASAGNMDCYAAYPVNFEMLIAWLVLPMGTDIFVNLLNLACMSFLGAALYGLARESGCRRRTAAWPAVAVCFAPAVWSLATTQYSDILVGACLVTGTLFLVRLVRTGHTVDGVYVALAAGLAAGTKYSAGPAAALLILLALLVTLWRARVTGKLRPVRWLPIGATLAVLVGGWQYARNWYYLGNPIYPFEVRFSESTVWRGSPVVDAVLEVADPGTRADDLRHLVGCFALAPVAWGPLVGLGVIAAVAWPIVGTRRDAATWTLTAFWVIGTAVFYAPADGLAAYARRHFLDTSTRFLLGYYGVAMVVACLWVGRRRVRRDVVVLVSLGVLVIHQTSAGTLPSAMTVTKVVAALGVTLLVTATVALVLRRYGRIFAVVLGAVLLVAASGGVVYLEAYRAATRYIYFRGEIDYRPIPRFWVAAAQRCDQSDRPLVVALAQDPQGAHDHWFYYPFMGSRLQNRVVYASACIAGATHRVRGDLDRPPRPRIWLDNLRELNVDMVYAPCPGTLQRRCIERHRDVFTACADGLYSVNGPALAAAMGNSSTFSDR